MTIKEETRKKILGVMVKSVWFFNKFLALRIFFWQALV